MPGATWEQPNTDARFPDRKQSQSSKLFGRTLEVNHKSILGHRSLNCTNGMLILTFDIDSSLV